MFLIRLPDLPDMRPFPDFSASVPQMIRAADIADPGQNLYARQSIS
ncbi:hypothetical protein AB1M95_17420 [Sulfitobacter sp. LCG007]